MENDVLSSANSCKGCPKSFQGRVILDGDNCTGFPWFILLLMLTYQHFKKNKNINLLFFLISWRPPSLSELTHIIFDMEVIHFGSKASSWLFSKIRKQWFYSLDEPKVILKFIK